MTAGFLDRSLDPFAAGGVKPHDRIVEVNGRTLPPSELLESVRGDDLTMPLGQTTMMMQGTSDRHAGTRPRPTQTPSWTQENMLLSHVELQAMLTAQF